MTSGPAPRRDAAAVVDVLAEDLRSRLPSLKRGSLRVFGDVFGGRVDNVHTIVGVRARGDCLLLDFDRGELLQVWEPDGVTADARVFRIERATRVRWEWFHYGREPSPENRRLIEHVLVGDEVTVTTDSPSWARGLAPAVGRPAVELVGF